LGKGGRRSIGKKESLLVGGFATAALNYQAVEGETGQGAQVAIALEAIEAGFLQLLPGALAGYHLAIIGTTRRQPGMDEPGPLTVGTGWRFLWRFNV